jgi:hypothetical protein
MYYHNSYEKFCKRSYLFHIVLSIFYVFFFNYFLSDDVLISAEPVTCFVNPLLLTDVQGGSNMTGTICV